MKRHQDRDAAIRAAVAAGQSQEFVAACYGITRQRVSQIVSGKPSRPRKPPTFTHIPKAGPSSRPVFKPGDVLSFRKMGEDGWRVATYDGKSFHDVPLRVTEAYAERLARIHAALTSVAAERSVVDGTWLLPAVLADEGAL